MLGGVFAAARRTRAKGHRKDGPRALHHPRGGHISYITSQIISSLFSQVMLAETTRRGGGSTDTPRERGHGRCPTSYSCGRIRHPVSAAAAAVVSSPSTGITAGMAPTNKQPFSSVASLLQRPGQTASRALTAAADCDQGVRSSVAERLSEVTLVVRPGRASYLVARAAGQLTKLVRF